MKLQRVGMRIRLTGQLRVGTMMTIGGMTNGRRAMMVTGKFRRLGGMMVQDGMDMPGNKNRPQGAEQCGSHDKGSESQKVGSVGSMIISPLLHELPCETVGCFVVEHGLAVDCKDFGLAGDDMSCGLAVGCDSCTHEP